MADRIRILGPQGQEAFVAPKVAQLLRARGWVEAGGDEPSLVPSSSNVGETIDFFASQPQYLDHMVSTWSALGESRGRFLVPPLLKDHAEARGVEATIIPSRERVPPGGLLAAASSADSRRAGHRPVVLFEHGAGQSYDTPHAAYAGGPQRENVVLFLVPNQNAARRDHEAYPNARVAVIGCPKLDVWEDRDIPKNEPPVVAISFHWECKLWPESRSALSHYKSVLSKLGGNGFHVLGHGHPRVFTMLSKLYEKAKIEPVRDFDEVLDRADIYVCDNSSTIYEFAATGRPVVLMNAPWYRRNVEHGLRFWSAATVGVQVDKPEQLIERIELALDDPPEFQAGRAKGVEEAYAYSDGKATDRAVKEIQGILAGRKA